MRNYKTMEDFTLISISLKLLCKKYTEKGNRQKKYTENFEKGEECKMSAGGRLRRFLHSV